MCRPRHCHESTPLLSQILDLYECRILANLKIMTNTYLLAFPRKESWTIDHFMHECTARSDVGGKILSRCSSKVEDAVKELLELVFSTSHFPTINEFDSEDIVKSKLEAIELFQIECMDMFAHFQHRNLESLLSSVRITLDSLRRHITTSTSRSTARDHKASRDESNALVACFQASLTLSLPNIVMQPSLEDMQNVINNAVQFVCEIGHYISYWTPPPCCIKSTTSVEHSATAVSSTKKVANNPQHSTYFKLIHECKDVVKMRSLLSSSILASRQDLMRVSGLSEL